MNGWSLQQKKDSSGKTGEIQIKPGVEFEVTYRGWFLCCDKGPGKCEMLIMEEEMRGLQEFSALSSPLHVSLK